MRPRTLNVSDMSPGVRALNPHLVPGDKLTVTAPGDGSAEAQNAYTGRTEAARPSTIEPHAPDSVPQLPSPKPKRHKAPALERADEGKAKSFLRSRVRFIGYRVRPLDPDNFAGGCKDLLDGLRHAGLIPGDEPWRIIFETEQIRVGSFAEERTMIEIDNPNDWDILP